MYDEYFDCSLIDFFSKTKSKWYKTKKGKKTFSLKCIYKRCIDSWNQLSMEINTINRRENKNSQEIKDIDLLDYSRPVLKDKLTKHILSKYEE